MLRSLPWFSLLFADLIVVVGATIGLVLLVVPGIAFYTCFGLVGPVMVQQRRGIRPSFARTLQISRTAVIPVLLLVVMPLATGQVIHEAAYRAVHEQAALIRVIVGWLVAAFVGGTVGLLEVALATDSWRETRRLETETARPGNDSEPVTRALEADPGMTLTPRWQGPRPIQP